MPAYLKYPDGRFSADKRSNEIEDLFRFRGNGYLVRNEDPLLVEEEQHQKRMVGHWVRPEVQDKPKPRSTVECLTIRL